MKYTLYSNYYGWIDEEDLRKYLNIFDLFC